MQATEDTYREPSPHKLRNLERAEQRTTLKPHKAFQGACKSQCPELNVKVFGACEAFPKPAQALFRDAAQNVFEEQEAQFKANSNKIAPASLVLPSK